MVYTLNGVFFDLIRLKYRKLFTGFSFLEINRAQSLQNMAISRNMTENRNSSEFPLI